MKHDILHIVFINVVYYITSLKMIFNKLYYLEVGDITFKYIYLYFTDFNFEILQQTVYAHHTKICGFFYCIKIKKNRLENNTLRRSNMSFFVSNNCFKFIF